MTPIPIEQVRLAGGAAAWRELNAPRPAPPRPIPDTLLNQLRAEFAEHLETLEPCADGLLVRFRRGAADDASRRFSTRLRQLRQAEHQCHDCVHYRRG